jgi:hypothetical protein
MRKGVVRGAASGRDNKAFSISAAEESEADRSEGRSKRQKEKEREEGRRPGAGLSSHRLDWPGRASTPTSESDHRRGKLGSRKRRTRAVSLLEGGIKSGQGGKGTFIVAKRRGRRDTRSGGLNRKRQRTSNDFTNLSTAILVRASRV